jgi:hypothetical protein
MGGDSKGSKNAKKAAAAQVDALNKAIAEQRRQYDLTRTDYKPYMDAGYQGIAGYSALAGGGTAEEQAAAIARLEGMPGFQESIKYGENAIMQNASATGGLRGGNTNTALFQFRPMMLQNAIQQQLGNYGNMINTGLGGQGVVTNMGGQTSSAISQFMQGQGDAVAKYQLSRQRALPAILSGAMQGASAGGQMGGQWGAVAGGVAGGFAGGQK